MLIVKPAVFIGVPVMFCSCMTPPALWVKTIAPVLLIDALTYGLMLAFCPTAALSAVIKSVASVPRSSAVTAVDYKFDPG